MPDVPNRDVLERELSDRLGDLFGGFAGHMLEELESANWNVDDIPTSVWSGLSKEEKAILLPFLERVSMQGAERLIDIIVPRSIDWNMINRTAAGWARSYSTFLAGELNNTSRDAIATSIRNHVADYFEEGLTQGQLTRRLQSDPNLKALFTEDVKDSLGRVFGPKRAKMIARTEVTRASMQGEVIVAQELKKDGIEMTAIWHTRKDEIVCAICGPRDGKPKGDGWNEEEPAHPRCRCWITHELPT